MQRIVLDTNVLVAAAYAPGSSSRKIVEASLAGRLEVVVSPAVLKEYHAILPRAVRKPEGYDQILRLLEQAKVAQLASVPKVVAEDPDDDKFVATAVAGGVDALVTNDRHLLALDPHQTIRILRPATFARHLEDGGPPNGERG
jgi:putative PIN family toxin of toxin-antitoxin system